MVMQTLDCEDEDVTLDINDFLDDHQGRRYTDVVDDTRFNFAQQLTFFNNKERQFRMMIAQEHFDLPAFGGVVKELEKHPDFQMITPENRAEFNRFKQALGVAVRILMEKLGWRKTGEKKSLVSISKIFNKTEVYRPPA